MEKEFNITGTCIPSKHYMVDTSRKIDETIINYIKRGKYFIINRPRQYGKTTTLFLLNKRLRASEEYLPIKISFEGVGDLIFENECSFSKAFLDMLVDNLEIYDDESAELLRLQMDNIVDLKTLSKAITRFVKKVNKKVVLTIDEVDKSSNNQMFLSFLGMLRNKYLLRNEDEDYTFHSVVLAGVHDVKTLKIKIRPDDERKYNSPWNIATDFNVDMSFSSEEISSMIKEYCILNNLDMNVQELSDRIYFFTNGYPFLVSRICKIVDEIIYEDIKQSWNIEDVDKAVKIITNEGNTLFGSVIKNLENDSELYDLTRRILINNEEIVFNILDPVINIGVTYGVFKNSENGLAISNKIFQEVIYNYMISKIRTKTEDMSNYNFKNNFITDEGGLDIEKILLRFQQYMKENYSKVDKKFIEREGRLIFMAFLAPIINGVGFAFKEAQISDEKRLDIVISYNTFKYIIELKIWRGNAYHEKGLLQLEDYLSINDINKGYLLVFNCNKDKEYKEENNLINNKEIFSVFV